MGKTITELTAGKQEQRILRLAPYTRVSSNPKISFTLSQRRSNIIQNTLHQHPEYELVDIYADEGVTGTRMDKRDDFNRLIRDCKKGKIDRIITKSVSPVRPKYRRVFSGNKGVKGDGRQHLLRGTGHRYGKDRS